MCKQGIRGVTHRVALIEVDDAIGDEVADGDAVLVEDVAQQAAARDRDHLTNRLLMLLKGKQNSNVKPRLQITQNSVILTHS